MKIKKLFFILCILFLLGSPIYVSALDTNSSNYGITSAVISSGGTNTTSTNYKTSSILGTITGNIISTLYKTFLGFFYSTGDDIFPKIYFVSPTPASGTITSNTSVIINVSINETNLANFTWMWNNTNYTFYDDSLLLMYNFDNVSSLGESSTAVVDVSRYGNDGTITGATWNNSGKIGGAYVFDGIDDYISMPTLLNFNDRLTWCSWVKTNSSAGNKLILDKNQNAYLYQVPSTGLVRFRITNSTLAAFSIDASTYIPDNTWHYICGVVNGTGNKIFLVIDGVVTLDDVNFIGTIPNTALVSIGGRITEPTTYSFNGTIDEVRIYNRSLSASEVQQHYYSNLYKYDVGKWQFITNQTLTRTGGSALYNYQACAEDISGNANCTEIRNLTYTDLGCVGQNYVFTAGQNINESCTLNTNINSSTTCFNITANNVVLNCNGYSINYSTVSSGYGIYLLNRSNVTIVNCLIRQMSWQSGRNIYLSNITNSFVTNNTLVVLGHASYGIYVDSNSKNTIISNNYIDGGIGSSSQGIYLNSVNNITLLNNSINSTVYSNGYGIHLALSSNCTLQNNTIFSSTANNYMVTGNSLAQYNHSIGLSNLAEGLPVMYNYSLSNLTYSNQNWSTTYGEVICGFCTNITYSNVSFSYDGLVFSYTTYSTIKNCTFNNTRGNAILFIQGSNNNLLVDNRINISSNGMSGINLYAVSGETITNNDIFATGTANGIFVQYAYGACYVNITRNRITTNNGAGLSYLYSYMINVSDNVFIVNNSYGINSNGYPTAIIPNYFYRNNITTNSTCIYLTDTHLHYFKDTLCNSKLYGFQITSGNNTIVDGGIFNTQNHSIKIEGININNNSFSNLILNSSAELHIFVNSTSYAEEIFTNLTYNKSKVIVLGNVTSFFKWYVDVNVTNITGSPVQNANVTIWDAYSNQVFFGATQSNGLITRQNLTEYFKNSTTEYYYTNYTFNATVSVASVQISQNFTNNIQVNLTLSLLPGKVTLIEPTNGNTTIHERQPVFIWQTPTGTSTYYEINISSNFCPNINQQISAPTANYTPTIELCTKTDYDQTNIYYNWTVRACNSYGCGEYSNLWNFTIEPWVVITIENNTLDFGNMILNQVKNTTSLNPMPFILRNDGNVISNMINISANNSLWASAGAGLGTSYFQMMAGETAETGSFNLSSSIMSWVNIGANNQTVIHQLNYNNSKDSAYLHLQLTVPGDEPPGEKQTTLFFTWEQTP